MGPTDGDTSVPLFDRTLIGRSNTQKINATGSRTTVAAKENRSRALYVLSNHHTMVWSSRTSIRASTNAPSQTKLDKAKRCSISMQCVLCSFSAGRAPVFTMHGTHKTERGLCMTQHAVVKGCQKHSLQSTMQQNISCCKSTPATCHATHLHAS